MARSSRWPKGVTTFKDRHGKRRYRYRCKGFQRVMPHPDSPEFNTAYAQAILDASKTVRSPHSKYTLSWLLSDYQRHDKSYHKLGVKRKKDKDRLMTRMQDAWGKRNIQVLTAEALTKIMDDVKAPTTYNQILGIWRSHSCSR